MTDRPTIWVFDVDATLFDSHTGTSLRPGTVALLEHLRGRGDVVFLWSAGGSAYARTRAEAVGVGQFFEAFLDKDARDASGRIPPVRVDASVARVIYVDDSPEDLPVDVEVITVSPYLVANPHDRGLVEVAGRADLVLEGGVHSGNERAKQ